MNMKCRECGKTFRSTMKWTMCPECIAIELTGAKVKGKPNPIARSGKSETESEVAKASQSVESENLKYDAKRASELGLSYGQYMAERRTGRI